MFERGGLVVLATLVTYVWLAPHAIMNGDNADLAGVGHVGGAAHPSGYPLYVMWLRLWSWLPGSPAYVGALATIVIAAGAVLVLHAACRAWGASSLAASFATALYATSPIVMRIHTEAEVFALNALVCATVLWLSATNGPLRGRRRAFVLGLVAGLGIAHNLTCVLYAPVGILGVVRGAREQGPLPRALVLAVAGLVVGLTPYIYLLVAPETPVSWGKVHDLGDLVRHALRMDYGVWQVSAHGTGLHVGDNLGELASTTLRAYWWGPTLVGVGALVYFCVRPHGPETVWAWRLLALVAILVGPLLVGRLNVLPRGNGLYLTQRFHLQTVLVLAVFVATGLDAVATKLALAERLARLRAFARAVPIVVFIAGTALVLPYLARVHTPAVEMGLRNMLETAPPNAIILGAPDEFYFGMNYLQGAVGLRTDVAVITNGQLGLAYYRERVRQRTGIVIERPDSADEKLSVTIAEQALATRRRVFIDGYQLHVAQSFPLVPFGLLYEVLPRGSNPPPIEDVFELNKRLYEAYRFGYTFPGRNAQHATQMHDHYARTWDVIATALDKAGRAEQAAEARAFRDQLAPREDE